MVVENFSHDSARDAAKLVSSIGNLGRQHGGLPCPYCKVPAFIRSSDLISETSRDIYFTCSLCGCNFKGQLAGQYIITPGQWADGVKVPLPVRTLTRREVNMALADARAASSDDQPNLLHWQPPDGGAPPGG